MSSYIVKTKVTEASIPNASAGKVNEFVDTSDGLTKSKDESGVVQLYSAAGAVAVHVADPDPHANYETTTELNARDSANRNRANHTGTQLSSSVSDFASTVRSTVLTGISFLTSAAVVATDSIIIAIGKLQAQLTSLTSIVSANVFGQGFEDFLATTPFTTASGTDVVARTFTTTSKLAGRYRISVEWNFTGNSISSSNRFKVFVDGVQLDDQLEVELKDTTDSIVYVQYGYVSYAVDSTHTIELRVNTESTNTVTINTTRCEIWRVS